MTKRSRTPEQADLVSDLEPLCGPPVEAHRYLMDTLWLSRVQRQLTRGAPEQAVFVSGPRVEKCCVPLVSYEPEYVVASASGLDARPESTHRILRVMDGAGHVLLGMFHSHPGMGAESVHPSGTDIAAQARFEQFYEAISGIFSRGRREYFVRFFSNRMPFRVELFGRGEEVEPNVFRIVHL